MGKDSLIKSTAKSKGKEEAKTKKTTAKKKAAKKATTKRPVPKAAKKKTPVKKKSSTKAATKKAPAKAKVKVATPKKAKSPSKSAVKSKAKTVAKKPAKKMSIKALLRKSFGPISTVAPASKITTLKKRTPSAPPWISPDDPQGAAHLRSLLSKSFSMADIQAATASPPTAPAPSKDATTVVPDQPPVSAAVVPAPSSASAGMADMSIQPASDPVAKMVKMSVAGLGILILMILLISNSNSKKYYIQPKDNAIEIRKGLFSPKDDAFFMVLHGIQYTGPVKEVYSRDDIFPIIFNYYLDKADTLLEASDLPDFDGIKIYLNDARQFAITPKMNHSVNIRLNTIERLILIYKADVAISKGTLPSLDTAVKHLTAAQKLASNPTQGQEIQQKLDLAASLKAALEAKKDQEAK